jgi:hypothetical protein
MKKRYALGLAVILLVAICVDFYIKVTCSNNSTNGKNYIDLYESKNLYRLKNIYLITFVNIILGGISIFLLLKSMGVIPRSIIYTFVAIASLVTFLNLFSLL